MAGQGGNLGPELSDIGARRGLAFLRGALCTGKQRSLSEDGFALHLPVLAVANDGRIFTGIRVNEDTFTIQIRDANRLYSLQKKRPRRITQARRQHDANLRQDVSPGRHRSRGFLSRQPEGMP